MQRNFKSFGLPSEKTASFSVSLRRQRGIGIAGNSSNGAGSNCFFLNGKPVHFCYRIIPGTFRYHLVYGAPSEIKL